MKIRRVVTGHDAQGKSIFVSDVQVEPTTVSVVPGAEFHQLWGGDTAPSFPGDGAMPAHTTYFPPVGGFRWGVFSLAPTGVASAQPTADELAAGLAELEAKLPGLAQYLEPDAPGMHTTPTIDFEVIVSGEVTLELDDSATVVLRAGDTIVQNGTRHRWRNDGAARAVIAYFICGAHHAQFPQAAADASTSLADRNKRAAVQFWKALDCQDFETAGALMAPDFRLWLGAQQLDREQTWSLIREVYQAFSGFTHDIEEMFAVDDVVVARITDRATHTGTFEGTAATGRSISIGQISILRMKDGRIVEIREQADMLGLMQQVGALPASTT
jgi:steroid delta-isomerase-like uncharacterized protein